jgi:hypothetical protein
MTDMQRCTLYTQTKGPHGLTGLPNVTRWSGYTRQPQTEITRPASQHSLMHLMHNYLPNLIIVFS